MQQVILASTSPRRIELFQKLGVPFKIVSTDYQEDMSQRLPPIKLVKKLALGKAETAAKKFPEHIVIAADTFVVVAGKKLGKPKNNAEALEMLMLVNGKKVRIITAVAFVKRKLKRPRIILAEADVYFRKISRSEAKGYIATGEPLDKAGAFAVQGGGAVFIKHTVGNFTDMLGMPLYNVALELEKLGIKIWPACR